MLDRYLSWIERRRVLVLVASLVLMILGGLAASRLALKSDLSSLLPPSKRSVQDLHVLQQRARAFGNVLVMVEVDRPDQLAPAVAQAVARFRALDRTLVSDVIEDDRALPRWIWGNRFVFAELADLEAARTALAERIRTAKLDANPLFIDLDDDEAPAAAKPENRLGELQRRLAEAERAASGASARVSKDGTAQLIEMKATFASSNTGLGTRLMSDVRAAIKELERTAHGAPAARYSLAGSVNISIYEHDSVIDGMALAALITIGLVGLAMLLYFRSPLPIAALMWSLFVGLGATFLFAWAAIGHLNLLSAFLTAIVVGNGINPGLMLMARVFEERRTGQPTSAAIHRAVRGAGPGTLAATLTAAVAYAALVVTDFRGFRHFGVIGGVGMLACWATAFSVLPAALFSLGGRGGLRAGREPLLGVWLGKLAPTRPRPVIAIGAALTLISVIATVVYVARDPFATDWRDLQSDSADIVAQHRVDARMSARFERKALSGGSYRLAIAVPDRATVPAVISALKGARDRRGEPLFGDVHWYDELVPRDQPAKLAVLAEVRKLLDDPGIAQLTPEERGDLAKVRPPDDLREVTSADVPQDLGWPFVEQDGSVGKLIFAWGAPRFSTWNVADRLEFATAVRQLSLPPGTAIGGEALVIADIVETLKHDAPIMSIVALLGSLLGVWLVVRLRRHGMIAVGCGLAGVFMMIAVCAAVGIRVHFLDLVALPITIGIGIDYAVNLAARDRVEGGRLPPRALLTASGAAVVLCSFTTAVGYGSLLLSSNGGIRAFGLAAIIGEVTCLVMALILAPALLVVSGSRPERVPPDAAAP